MSGSLPLTFSGPPGAGDHTLHVSVGYQACDASICHAPAIARVDLPVKEVSLVGLKLPTRSTAP